MATRKKQQQDETLIDISKAGGQAKDFFARNQKMIVGIVGGLALLIGGYFAYTTLYKAPKEQKAIEQMYMAEFQFGNDSFQLALDNPGGGFDGFLTIIDKYSGTKSANLAKYYAGICYLNLRKPDEAIKYLNDFSPKGNIIPIMKYGALGDAYSEKEDYEKALSLYEKAAKAGDDEILTPYYLKKLGMLQERQGNKKAGLQAYEQIKDKYPTSVEASAIEKYISRVSASIE